MVRGNLGLHVDPGGKDGETGTFVPGRDGGNTSLNGLV